MDNKYNNYTDEELVRLINKNSEAEDALMIRYKDLVRKKAGTMFLIGGEREDLIQEGMIGLLRAIRSFENDKGASFSHYADVCISSKMYSAIESSKRQKHIPLNSYISLYEENNVSGEGNGLLMDALVALDDQNPEHLIIDRENVEQLDNFLSGELSKLENEVLNLLISGLGYVEIAVLLNKSPKQIDNAIQRIRSKLKKALNK